MTHNWIAWGLGILGSVGVIGWIAAAVFAPPLALAIWNVVRSVFLSVFKTRLGFGAIVGIAVYFGASWYQHRIDEENYAQRTADFRAAQKARDASIRKDAEAFVRKQIADEFIAQQESDYELSKFNQALDPAAACRVGADAPRLRKLWGLGR